MKKLNKLPSYALPWDNNIFVSKNCVFVKLKEGVLRFSNSEVDSLITKLNDYGNTLAQQEE